MQLQISTWVAAGDKLIVNCKGRIVAGDEITLLRHQVRDLVDVHPQIILNLAEVNYVDSTGIGTLVELYTAAKNAGGNICLAGLMKRIHDLLQITKLLTVFETFPTVDDAVATINQRERSQPQARSAD